MTVAAVIADSWKPAGWRERVAAQQPTYPDPALLDEVERKLAASPPVVAIDECEALRRLAAGVANGDGFILQGGDCAEMLGGQQATIVNQLCAMFDRLGSFLPQPVVSIARIAGQFAKPRTAAVETRGEISLPAYRGDGINGSAFTAQARRADPQRMVEARVQAAETAALIAKTRVGRAPLFASHEALLLPYEQALARRDSTDRWWATSGHMLWVGDRSRQVDGAHVHFLSGVENVIGVKCGPSIDPTQLLRLLDRLDPANRPGKIALIGRFGALEIERHLPALLDATQRERRQVLWMIDPMHGNGRVEGSRKVRRLDDIMAETRRFFAIARDNGVHPAGIHLEMTPDDVTECVGRGGADDADGMAINFHSLCDPRLNAVQAEELVRMVAGLVRESA